MREAEQLRLKANRCREVARGTADPKLKGKLLKAIEMLEERAAALEAKDRRELE